jgi:hypothetical protein
MNHWKPGNSAVTNTLGLLVAAMATAAIVLTSTAEYEERRVMPTDANERRGGAAATVGAPTALPAAAPNDDPELKRIDRANDHHG